MIARLRATLRPTDRHTRYDRWLYLHYAVLAATTAVLIGLVDRAAGALLLVLLGLHLWVQMKKFQAYDELEIANRLEDEARAQLVTKLDPVPERYLRKYIDDQGYYREDVIVVDPPADTRPVARIIAFPNRPQA